MKQVRLKDLQRDKFYLFYCNRFDGKYRHFQIRDCDFDKRPKIYYAILCRTELKVETDEYIDQYAFRTEPKEYNHRGVIFELSHEEVLVHLFADRI